MNKNVQISYSFMYIKQWTFFKIMTKTLFCVAMFDFYAPDRVRINILIRRGRVFENTPKEFQTSMKILNTYCD